MSDSRKNAVLLHIKLDKSEEIDDKLEQSDLDILAYDKQWRQYRIRLKEPDIESNLEILTDLVAKAKEEYNN